MRPVSQTRAVAPGRARAVASSRAAKLVVIGVRSGSAQPRRLSRSTPRPTREPGCAGGERGEHEERHRSRPIYAKIAVSAANTAESRAHGNHDDMLMLQSFSTRAGNLRAGGGSTPPAARDGEACRREAKAWLSRPRPIWRCSHLPWSTDRDRSRARE